MRYTAYSCVLPSGTFSSRCSCLAAVSTAQGPVEGAVLREPRRTCLQAPTAVPASAASPLGAQRRVLCCAPQVQYSSYLQLGYDRPRPPHPPAFRGDGCMLAGQPFFGSPSPPAPPPPLPSRPASRPHVSVGNDCALLFFARRSASRQPPPPAHASGQGRAVWRSDRQDRATGQGGQVCHAAAA